MSLSVAMACSLGPCEPSCSLNPIVRGGHDTALTPEALGRAAGVSAASSAPSRLRSMTEAGGDFERTIRRAIGGDPDAISWIETHADSTSEPTVIAMAALLEGHPERIDEALAVATTRRDRQLVAIARAHLRGDHQLVDALARDHLADHPDSFMVAWIASDAADRARGEDHR